MCCQENLEDVLRRLPKGIRVIEQWIIGIALLMATGALCYDGFAGACRSADNAANLRRAIPFACVAVIWALLTKIDGSSMQQIPTCSPWIVVEAIPLFLGMIAIIVRVIGMSPERKGTVDPRKAEQNARVARDLRMLSIFTAGFVLLCVLLRYF